MLTLVNGNAALKREPKHLGSASQTRTKIVLATISRAWQLLTPQQRQNFNALGQVWSPGKKSTSSGFAVFQSLNNVRFQTLGATTVLTDAPQKPDLLTEMLPFTVTATTSGAGVFELRVNTEGDYTGHVRVCATGPLSPGLTRFRAEDFRYISTENDMSAPGTPITAAYLARFAQPLVGMQIAVMLTPVTPNGFTGQAVWVPVTVVAAPGDAPSLTLK